MDFALSNVRLNASGRTDVGLGRPRAHDHAKTGVGNVCACAGSDLALFDHIVDQGCSENGDIEPLTSVDLAFQRTDNVKLDHQLVACCAFELGT
jgi:hypothetical protein